MNYKIILESYANAVYNKDIEKFIDLYDKTVHVYDTWNRWIYNDVEELRGMVTEWFDSLGKEKVRVEFNEISVMESKEQMVWIGDVKFFGLSEDDEVLRSIRNRWTWVIRNDKEGLKIVHEHSSLPINMETFKGIMKVD